MGSLKVCPDAALFLQTTLFATRTQKNLNLAELLAILTVIWNLNSPVAGQVTKVTGGQVFAEDLRLRALMWGRLSQT